MSDVNEVREYETVEDEVTVVHCKIAKKPGVSGELSENEEPTEEENVSEEDWKPCSQAIVLVEEMLRGGATPKQILSQMCPTLNIPESVPDSQILQLIIQIATEPPPRRRLRTVNTIDDAVKLFKDCRNIMVITGAGTSVSCGIPDFRSRDGIYARLSVDYPDLPDPQAMFDIRYFRKNPKPFFQFAKEIYPGTFDPSPSHRFIALLEQEGKLLRNFTQNIDGLDAIAGVRRLVQCHGSFTTATCCTCGYKTGQEAIKDDIMQQKIPRCPRCPEGVEFPVLKPDIVFFGESLGEQFHVQMREDRERVDLLVVIGSSMKVRPVNLIPNSISPNVPQILINREPLPHLNFDVVLLGDCDRIVAELSRRMGGSFESALGSDTSQLHECTKADLHIPEKLLTKDQLRFAYSCDDQASDQASMTSDQASDGDEKEEEKGGNEEITDENVKKSADGDGAVEEAVDEGPKPAKKRKVDEMAENLPESSSKNENDAKVLESDEKSSKLKNNEDSNDERWVNIADCLPECSYLFVPSHTYVFSGAEVFHRVASDKDENGLQVKRLIEFSSDDDDESDASSNLEEDAAAESDNSEVEVEKSGNSTVRSGPNPFSKEEGEASDSN